MKQSPEYMQDEFFRETVINQAILLGFSAQLYEPHFGMTTYRWMFTHEGSTYRGYSTIYHAALQYLRLSNFPNHLVGVVRAEVRD